MCADGYKKWKVLLVRILPLALVYVVALGVRRYYVNTQFRLWGMTLPFTLESAVHFRYVEWAFTKGKLPDRDAFVGYPRGICVRATHTVGDEYLYAFLARVLPLSESLQERVRWAEVIWFSAACIVVALWIWQRTGWQLLGVTAGLLLATSTSAVIRSTGLELSKENGAFPWLALHLWFDSMSYAWRGWRRVVAVTVSAMGLAIALCWWDMIQYYVMLWSVYSAWRIVRHRVIGLEFRSWITHWLVLVAVGLWNPYHREHGLLYSPWLVLGAGVMLYRFVDAAVRRGWIRETWGRPTIRFGLIVVPVLLSVVCSTAYADAYGHMGELLWAKLRYAWVGKPSDPGRLSFAQRIMWVPALNNASWPLTIALFPGILPVGLALLPVWVRRSDIRQNPETSKLFWYLSASFVTYVLFVRFHVFVVLFAAAWVGFMLAAYAKNGRLRAWVVGAVAVGMIAVETSMAIASAPQWGRTNVYYEELDELTGWLRDHVCPDPVVANFGVSGSIVAYGKCPVVLHPKFESREIRERVRQYGEHMFLGTERSLRNWVCEQGAEYLVYCMGEFSSVGWEQQMRYMVNARHVPSYAPARRFEFAPDSLRYFRLVWSNRKYRVFDVLTKAEERECEAYVRAARSALERGALDEAEYAAAQALNLVPGHGGAQTIIKHVLSLQEQGFETDVGP